jgi:hypothetical protein
MRRTFEAGWLPTTLRAIPDEGYQFHTPGTGGHALDMLFVRGRFAVIKRPGYNDTQGRRRRFNPVVYMLVQFGYDETDRAIPKRMIMRVLDRVEPGRASDAAYQRLCGRVLRLANGTEKEP